MTPISELAHYLAVAGTLCQSVTNTDCDAGLPKVTSNPLPTVMSIVFAIIAVLSVLMIVIAGLRFVTGQGNPQEISKARNTMIYAVVGLLVALAAEAIVQLVLGKL